MSKFFIKEEGISLYLAVIIMAILLAIVLGMTAILLSQIRMIKGMENSVVAFYAADTGIERVLYQDKMCRQDGCEVLSWPCWDTDAIPCNEGLSNGSIPGNVGAATYQANFTDGATTIQSVGTYKDTKRAIEVTK